MPTNNTLEFDCAALAAYGQTASWRRATPNAPRGIDHAALTIMDAGGTEEGHHVPAASVTVQGTDALKRLRAAVNQALGYDGRMFRAESVGWKCATELSLMLERAGHEKAPVLERHSDCEVKAYADGWDHAMAHLIINSAKAREALDYIDGKEG